MLRQMWSAEVLGFPFLGTSDDSQTEGSGSPALVVPCNVGALSPAVSSLSILHLENI